MKTIILALTLSVAAASGMTAATADYNVVPLPREISLQKGAPFVLSSATTLAVAQGDADGLMAHNQAFLRQYIAEATGIRVAETADTRHASIVLSIDSKNIANPEGYVMRITAKRISIAGGSAAGVFYAIQTLRKSLPIESAEEKSAQEHSVDLPAAVITDEPRFAWRGMLLDCGRYFYPVEFVKRFIDLIAMHNMNVFHWHLSEDQGWRIEIKRYPRLTEIGSTRRETVIGHSSIGDGKPHGGYYTQEQAREIVEYARQRHITVVPEIDMPGHTLSALASYPQLGCTGGPYEVSWRWGVFPDVLCLGNEDTYTFCQNVLAEIMDIFPSAYIHIGGDEAPHKRWAACRKCQSLMKREHLTPKNVQGYFTNRMEKFVNSHGRRIIGWDEILNGEINKTAVIQSWRGAETGQRAAEAGHDVIMSPTSHCYLDYQQTEDTRHEPSLIRSRTITVEKAYSFDPTANLSETAAKHILGVQGNVWGEFIPYSNLAEYQSLPRMAALAEVQWTSGQEKNFQAFLPRLTRLTSLYDLHHYIYAKHLWNSK